MGPKEEKKPTIHEASTPTVQVEVVVVATALYPGVKVTPTPALIAFCDKAGETFVPFTIQSGRHPSAVAPLGLTTVIEDGKLVDYIKIPDSTGKVFNVPLSVVLYKPATG